MWIREDVKQGVAKHWQNLNRKTSLVQRTWKEGSLHIDTRVRNLWEKRLRFHIKISLV